MPFNSPFISSKGIDNLCNFSHIILRKYQTTDNKTMSIFFLSQLLIFRLPYPNHQNRLRNITQTISQSKHNTTVWPLVRSIHSLMSGSITVLNRNTLMEQREIVQYHLILSCSIHREVPLMCCALPCRQIIPKSTVNRSQHALTFICSLSLASLLQLMCCGINIFVAVEYTQGYSQ